MRGVLILLVVGLLMFSPVMAQLQIPGFSGSLPGKFKDIKVQKEIDDSFIAGSGSEIKISFKNPSMVMQSLIVRVNVSSNITNVTENNFFIEGNLTSSSLYPGYPTLERKFTCFEKSPGVFYCLNLTEVNIGGCHYYPLINRTFCGVEGLTSYIILPGSENNLTLSVKSNVALEPSNYSFKVDLFSGIGLIEVDDSINKTITSQNKTLFDFTNTSNPLPIKVGITTNKNKTLSMRAYQYSFAIEELFAPKKVNILKSFSIHPNSEKNITKVEIKYNYSSLNLKGNEDSLYIYYWNDTSANTSEWGWERLNSTVDKEKNIISATTNHLSLFSVATGPSRVTSTKKQSYVGIPPISAAGGGGGEITSKKYLTIIPTSATMEQGKSKNFTIEVRNIGTRNIRSFEIFAKDSEIEKWIEITPKNESLGVRKTKNWTMTISVPENAEPGTKHFTIHTKGDNIPLKTNFTLTVAKKPEEFIKEEKLEKPQKVVENKTLNPPTNLSIVINNGAEETKSREVSLTLSAINVTECRLNNDGINWSDWFDYTEKKEWELSEAQGTKTVYFQCRNKEGESNITYDSIKYVVPKATLPAGYAILTNPTILASIVGGILIAILVLLYKKKPGKKS